MGGTLWCPALAGKPPVAPIAPFFLVPLFVYFVLWGRVLGPEVYFVVEVQTQRNRVMPQYDDGGQDRILYKDESYQLNGAIFEVYRDKGCGFVEPVYQECLEIELTARDVPFVSQPELRLEYKGKRLGQTFRPDLVCFGKIIVELKAARSLTDEHRAQLMNYLKATNLRLGLLVNFGHYPNVAIERIVM